MDEGFKKKVAGHRKRLREKFLELGMDGLTDEEIIELLLTVFTPRRDVKQSARHALKRFGSLSGVLEAPVEELREIKGIGPVNVMGLKMVHQAARRYLRDSLEESRPRYTPRAVLGYLSHAFRDLKREVFSVIHLDIKGRVMKVQPLFEGSLGGSTVYPREVVKAALDNNAAGLVLVHNHPSGDPEPSPHDIKLTEELGQAARLLGVVIVDHIIIGRSGRYYSFLEDRVHQGYLDTGFLDTGGEDDGGHEAP